MYLEYIKVKNFGVHESARVDFQDGLVVVRGGNGKGKSTISIQAPMYALFGASTLDATLDDTVTRGEKVSSLRVEAKYAPYVVKRSKASASVVGNGIEISGQAEVSNFFYELFGIQKGTESKVLVAEQGKVAGILSGKPGEVNSFIEDLAGFDQIDDLIERVKLKFPTGQKAVLESRLEELEGRESVLDVVELPDVEKMEEGIQSISEATTVFAKDLKDIEESISETNLGVQAGLTHNNNIDAATTKLIERKAHFEDLKSKLETAQAELKALPVFDHDDLTEAQDLIDQLDERNKEWAAYEWRSGLQEVDEWDEGLESFDRELKDTADDVANLGRDLIKVGSDIALKKAAIITDENCTLCGQGVKHLHEEINTKLNKEIKMLEELVEKEAIRWEELKDYLAVLNNINVEHLRRVRKANLDYLVVDTSLVPHRYSILGDEPTKPDSLAVVTATNLLGENEFTNAMIKSYKKSIGGLQEDIVSLLDVIIPRFEKELLELGEVINITESQEKLVELESQKIRTKEVVDKLNEDLTKAKLKLNTAEGEIKAHSEALSGLKEDIKSTLDLIKEDGRNGKIVKSVRDAKPQVLSLVWAKILYSVSVTFSDMVGWEAGVEKDAKGFRINSLPVARLSGSEKSVLGIALRATLRDIFAPTCGFMLFDEPYDSMDSDRTALASAAIHSIPGQKLVITHEADTEMSAEQFVEVGG